MDLPVLHRRDPLPAGPARDQRRVDRLAAPRGEDDLGIALDDGVGRDDAALGRVLVAQLGEDVAAARDLDDVRHPADPGDERVHPLLEVDARAVRPHRRVLADLSDFVSQIGDELARLALASQRAADQDDRIEDVVEGALVRAEHAHPGADQVADNVALKI